MLRLLHFGCNLVEVTGGEPLAQKNAFPFITELCERRYEVLIETADKAEVEVKLTPKGEIKAEEQKGKKE